MFALPIFTARHQATIGSVLSLTSVFGMAASPSAAGGGASEGAAWAAVEISRAFGEEEISGTATANRWTRPPGNKK